MVRFLSFDSQLLGPIHYDTSFSFYSDKDLMEMIERADTDNDGEITLDDFYAIMTKKTFT